MFVVLEVRCFEQPPAFVAKLLHDLLPCAVLQQDMCRAVLLARQFVDSEAASVTAELQLNHRAA